jgi:hypothetical protein
MRAAAYYCRRIGDTPWMVIGNYLAAWIFLAGAVFLIRGYEYDHMVRIWQPLIPIQGPAMIVPGLALLGAYLILPSRLGVLPASLVVFVHIHLHQTTVELPLRLGKIIGILWHVAFFPLLILISLVLIGELTWPFVRSMVAVRGAWTKQRVLTRRLATQQRLEQQRHQQELYLEQQRHTLAFQAEQQRLEDQKLTLDRKRRLQLQHQDIIYRREQARLTLAQVEADKLIRKANAQLVAPQPPQLEVQLAPMPIEAPPLGSESAT